MLIVKEEEDRRRKEDGFIKPLHMATSQRVVVSVFVVTVFVDGKSHYRFIESKL